MSKDKVKVYVGDTVSMDALCSNTNWRYNSNDNSCYWYCSINEYYLNYLLVPGSNTIGFLTIDVSISKLINGNNAIPATKINIDELIARIYYDLKAVLNFNMIPDIKKWVISKDETFIDIIASKEIIESIYHLIEYSRIPHRKVDKTYKNKGSIYIHSGNKREKSTYTLIAYDKGKECARRGIDITNIKKLEPEQSCLRLEVKIKRYSLKKNITQFKNRPLFKEPNNNFTLNKIDYNYSYKYISYDYDEISNTNIIFSNESIKHITMKDIIDSKIPYTIVNYNYYFKLIDKINKSKTKDNKLYFTDILDVCFQAYSLKNILKELHLFNTDITILTRKDLFKFIIKGVIFKTPKTKSTAKKIIEFLNGEKAKAPCCSKTINRYKNILLNAGIHYLYLKYYIPEISQAMLNKAIYETGELIIE